MTIENLKAETLQLIDKYPELRTEFKDFFYLAISEIEEGGSERHECDLASSDMQDLVKEFEKKNGKKFF